MFTDKSKKDTYPKTLVIRNHEGGLVWQIYHIKNIHEASKLSSNATMNGFYAITLEDYQSHLKQTWEDWRENCDFVLPEDK